MDPQATPELASAVAMTLLFTGFALPMVILGAMAARSAPTRWHRLVPIGAIVAYFVGGVAYVSVGVAGPTWFGPDSWLVKFGVAAFVGVLFVVVLTCAIAFRQTTAEKRRVTYLVATILGAINLSLYAATLAVPAWWNVFFLVPYLAVLIPLTMLIARQQNRKLTETV